MHDLGPATEADMISAFVLAEIDSPTFAPKGYRPWFNMHGLDLDRVRSGLLAGDDRVLSLARTALRDIRGYGQGVALFIGFPSDVAWRSVELTQDDVEGLRYCSFPTWVQLTGGTRCVRDGAKAVRSGACTDTELTRKVNAIAADVRGGKKYPALIAVREVGQAPILIEGHNRATAFTMAEREEPSPAIVGITKSLAGWRWH